MQLITIFKHIMRIVLCCCVIASGSMFAAAHQKQQQVKAVKSCCCTCCNCVKTPCFCCTCWCSKCCARSCCLDTRAAWSVKNLPQSKLILLAKKGSMDLRATCRDSGDYQMAVSARGVARQETGITSGDAQNAAAVEKAKITALLAADTKSTEPEISPAHADLIKQQQAARAALRTASKSINAPSTTRKPFNEGMVRSTRPLPGSAYETTSTCASPSHQQSPHQLAVPQLSSSTESIKPLTPSSATSSPTSIVLLPQNA